MPGTTANNVATSKHLATTAGQVDTIGFATNFSEAVVVMKTPASGSAGLFVTSDGSTVPSAGGDDTDWVPPVAGAFVRLKLGPNDTVKVFSATVDSYFVKGVA